MFIQRGLLVPNIYLQWIEEEQTHQHHQPLLAEYAVKSADQWTVVASKIKEVDTNHNWENNTP